jgi:hypothetical protein
MDYNRHELVSAINLLLREWTMEHHEGSALLALDALGYTAGLIFSQAPDIETKVTGRMHFMYAMEEGLRRADLPKWPN